VLTLRTCSLGEATLSVALVVEIIQRLSRCHQAFEVSP